MQSHRCHASHHLHDIQGLRRFCACHCLDFFKRAFSGSKLHPPRTFQHADFVAIAASVCQSDYNVLKSLPGGLIRYVVMCRSRFRLGPRLTRRGAFGSIFLWPFLVDGFTELQFKEIVNHKLQDIG